MGFRFSRRKRLGKNTTLNISKSGLSVSRKAGPLTVNSRGQTSLKLFKGASFRKKLW